MARPPWHRRTWVRLTGVGTAAAALLVALGPRARVDPARVPAPQVRDDVEGWLEAREDATADLRPTSRARVVWADPQAKGRTDVVVVYLHGFSADPSEIQPVPERVAGALGANLLLARLTGHGHDDDGATLGATTAEDWLADARTALALGQRLGDRVVLWGTSTGGTLAVWLAASDAPDAIAALVLTSPNFAPRDPAAQILLWPWGLQVAKRVIGERRTWTTDNAAEALHWTTSYPVEALVEMMALTHFVDGLDLSDLRAPSLVLYDPADQVVDSQLTERRVRTFGRKPLIRVVDDPDDALHHVITGEILSPSTVDAVTTDVVTFLRGALAD